MRPRDKHAAAFAGEMAESAAVLADMFDDADTPRFTNFGESCVFTGATDDRRITWQEERRKYLTASSMAAILGQDPYNDAYDVFVEKTQPIIRPEPTIEDGPIFWGKVLEQPILTAAAKAYTWKYKPGGALLRSRKYPLLACTLDAEIERGDGRGWGVLEGKTTVLVGQWNEKDGELPARVLIQGQHQMLVTGAPFCVVFALLNGSRKCMIELEPSAEFFAMIIDEAEAFHELVLAGDKPTPTHKSHVAQRFPRDDGSTIKLPIEFVEVTRDYFETMKAITRLEQHVEGLKNRVRDALGTATYGGLDEPVEGKGVWRWQVEASGNRVLRPLKDFPDEHPERAARRAKLLAQNVTLHTRVSAEQSAEVAHRFKSGRRRMR
jgi:putative phage-type endonuclease